MCTSEQKCRLTWYVCPLAQAAVKEFYRLADLYSCHSVFPHSLEAVNPEVTVAAWIGCGEGPADDCLLPVSSVGLRGRVCVLASLPLLKIFSIVLFTCPSLHLNLSPQALSPDTLRLELLGVEHRNYCAWDRYKSLHRGRGMWRECVMYMCMGCGHACVMACVCVCM